MSDDNRSMIQRFLDFTASLPIPTIVLSLIGFLAIGSIGYSIYNNSFKIFGDPIMARGLITFMVAILTVTLAIILVLAAILGTSSDFEKRFSLGKEILMVFVGILGTIMGFYYGENKVSTDVVKELADNQKISVSDVEKKGFNSIISNDFMFAADAFAEAYRISPTFHNVDEINKLFQSQKAEFIKADLNKDEAKKKLIWNKIYCDISKNYLWGISSDIKEQFKEKIAKENYNCSQPTNVDTSVTTNTNSKAN